jgi:hypothetical protein
VWVHVRGPIATAAEVAVFEDTERMF